MAMAVSGMKFTEFLNNYNNATTKAEEAAAILDVVQQVREDQAIQRDETRKEILKEIQFQDLVTKKDLDAGLKTTKLELQKEILALELRISKQISSSKWQLIGTMVVLIVVPLFLRHFGV